MTEAIHLDEPASMAGSRRPGWTERLLAGVAKLPGPQIAWYVLLPLAVALGAHVPIWIAGERPVGNLDPLFFVPTALTAYALGLIHVLNRVALSSFRTFRTALDGQAGAHERLALELVSIPDRWALAAVVLFVVVITAGFLLDPGGTGRLADMPIAVAFTLGVLWWLAIAAVALLIVHTVRQLQLVCRLHAMATTVDPFEPTPVTAFSRLTAATALGILVIGLYFAVPRGDEAQYVVGVIQGIGFIALACFFFVAPLLGMHDRLRAEKSRLLTEVHARLKVTRGRIHASVDSGDLSQAEQLERTLSGLLAEREVISRLPTWPWEPATLRGFVSALAVPVVLWLILRVLERFL